MLFFNANFICYYFYPTKKREEPIFSPVIIHLRDYPLTGTCLFSETSASRGMLP
jgi:hypothetical protein